MAKRKTLIQIAMGKLTEDEFVAITMHHYDEGRRTGKSDGITLTIQKMLSIAGDRFQTGHDEAAKAIRECVEQVRTYEM